MRTPFFKTEGAFQTTGGDADRVMNTVASMDRLRAYVLGRGDQAAAEIALAYLEQTYPKMAVVCSALRDTFVMEEYDGENTRERAARRAYNKIVDRLSNTPI